MLCPTRAASVTQAETTGDSSALAGLPDTLYNQHVCQGWASCRLTHYPSVFVPQISLCPMVLCSRTAHANCGTLAFGPHQLSRNGSAVAIVYCAHTSSEESEEGMPLSPQHLACLEGVQALGLARQHRLLPVMLRKCIEDHFRKHPTQPHLRT